MPSFFLNLMDNHSIVKQSLNDKLAGRVMETQKNRQSCRELINYHHDVRHS